MVFRAMRLDGIYKGSTRPPGVSLDRWHVRPAASRIVSSGPVYLLAYGPRVHRVRFNQGRSFTRTVWQSKRGQRRGECTRKGLRWGVMECIWCEEDIRGWIQGKVVGSMDCMSRWGRRTVGAGFSRNKLERYEGKLGLRVLQQRLWKHWSHL